MSMKADDNQLPFADVIGVSVNDMRNSLGQVLYKLTGISEELDTQESKLGLQVVEYEVTRMQNVMNQLHGLYLIETDSLTIQMQEVYVFELIDDILAGMNGLLANKKVEVELRGEDICWYLDPYLMTNVLNIAILNAVRYTNDKICITLVHSEKGLSISIDDNGQGYPDVVLERFNNVKAGMSIEEVSSQNIGWLFCEKIASLHKNQGNTGETILDNESVISGGRLQVLLP